MLGISLSEKARTTAGTSIANDIVESTGNDGGAVNAEAEERPQPEFERNQHCPQHCNLQFAPQRDIINVFFTKTPHLRLSLAGRTTRLYQKRREGMICLQSISGIEYTPGAESQHSTIWDLRVCTLH